MKKIIVSAMLLASSVCSVSAAEFTVTSPQIKQGQSLANEQLYAGFGCSGGNVSPELNWQNPPAGTKSFAVSVYDPAAPTGSGWWHWMVFNIPAQTNQLAKGISASGQRLPAGAIQARTDFGQSAYGGACPPQGDKAHPYIFTVYALSSDNIPLDSNAPSAMVGFMIHNNLLAKTSITAYSQRGQ
ncbi:MAG: YbhB/YbcL family Raf kinase inhibitor-like protein [Enterobacteriaceae bacterium]|nr:YbhB/YbcL family Raf kinase inhibitor-like protein [Enterobacteriaceae bacterium]